MKVQAHKTTRRQFARETLKAIGMDRSQLRRRFRGEPVLVGLLVMAAILTILLGLSFEWPEQLLSGLSLIIALIAFAFGYLQWRAGRHEVSFDRYYDKLELANKWYNDWQLELRRSDPEELQDHLKHMFIFAELDKLEYILEKFKLGYVRQDLVERAIRAFRARCEASADFRQAVQKLIEDQERQEKYTSYHKSTREAVRYITEHLSALDDSL
jgi:hypothetical protein